MLHRRRIVFAAGTLAASLALSGCGGDAGGGEAGRTSVKMPESTAAADAIAYQFGIDRGIFENHGIDAEQVSVPASSAALVPLLLNGQLDIGTGSIVGTMQAVNEGLPVCILSALTSDNEENGRPVWDVIVPADSDVQSFADLAGKSVAVNSVKAVNDLALNEAVSQQGGDWTTIDYVTLRFPEQVPALTSGNVDAVFTVQPFASALLSQGYRSIGDPIAAAFGDPRIVAVVMQASQAFVDQEPEAAKKFVDALQEANDYANAHPEEVRDTAVSEANASGPAAEAIKRSPLPHYTTEVAADTIAKWGDLMVKYGVAEEAPNPSDVLCGASE